MTVVWRQVTTTKLGFLQQLTIVMKTWFLTTLCSWFGRYRTT